MNNIKVEIPVEYILQIAVHGNMGTGELPDLMRIWARRVCQENGLSDEFSKRMDKNLESLKKSLTNVLGKDVMNKVDDAINDGKKALEIVGEMKKDINPIKNNIN